MTTAHAHGHAVDPHESPLTMLIPLAVLAVGALFAGVVFRIDFVGEGVADFWKRALNFGADNHILEDDGAHAASRRAVADGDDGRSASWSRSTSISCSPERRRALARDAGRCSTASCSTSGISTNSTISSSCGRRCGSAACSGRAATAPSSTASGPTASRRACSTSPRNVVRLQTGYLYHYAFAMLIGVAALHHLVHVRGSALMTSLAILSVVTFLPLVGALFILRLRGDDEAALRNARWVALWTTLITFAISLVAGLALRSRLGRLPVRRGEAAGSAAPSATRWASTAFRCRS